MTVAKRILQVVAVSGPLDDDEIAQRLKIARQQVNQAARRLEATGRLRRYVGGTGKIVNEAVQSGSDTAPRLPQEPPTSPLEPPGPTPTPAADELNTDLLLVSCVKSKADSPRAAKDLYASPLFEKERAYAEGLGVPWFILSAEHGLVGPDEWLAPYERYLPDTPTAYRLAWANWVVARLELLAGDLRGRRVEIHASGEYVNAVREPLQARGATIEEPLAGLTHGQRLHWYNARAGALPERVSLALPDTEALVLRLTDANAAMSPAALLEAGPSGLKVPGLYSWWVDEPGAADLSTGLGHEVRPGLVYAGLAGATRWPSGKRSTNTLWLRITGMHLGSKHGFSTLRRTFGSILCASKGWSTIDEAALTSWMKAHLRVVLMPYADADDLSRVEEEVLTALDPPLNLKGVGPSEVRRELRHLRSTYASQGPKT